jgi:hypothetical protein
MNLRVFGQKYYSQYGIEKLSWQAAQPAHRLNLIKALNPKMGKAFLI